MVTDALAGTRVPLEVVCRAQAEETGWVHDGLAGDRAGHRWLDSGKAVAAHPPAFAPIPASSPSPRAPGRCPRGSQAIWGIRGPAAMAAKAGVTGYQATGWAKRLGGPVLP
jgi:hypothetical protein